jgi:hypothetical protein
LESFDTRLWIMIKRINFQLNCSGVTDGILIATTQAKLQNLQLIGRSPKEADVDSVGGMTDVYLIHQTITRDVAANHALTVPANVWRDSRQSA